MTAAQLAHLAELAALAADYFGVSAPDAARLFGKSAYALKCFQPKYIATKRRHGAELGIHTRLENMMRMHVPRSP